MCGCWGGIRFEVERNLCCRDRNKPSAQPCLSGRQANSLRGRMATHWLYALSGSLVPNRNGAKRMIGRKRNCYTKQTKRCLLVKENPNKLCGTPLETTTTICFHRSLLVCLLVRSFCLFVRSFVCLFYRHVCFSLPFHVWFPASKQTVPIFFSRERSRGNDSRWLPGR